MTSAYENLTRIVGNTTTPEQRVIAMRGFAEQLQWTPSYEVQGTFGLDMVSGHLVVEHGLENSATISFLKAPFRASELNKAQLRALLGISYNNLVEWHLFVSQDDVRCVNNLAELGQSHNSDRIDSLTRIDLEKYLSGSDLSSLFSTDGFRRSVKACDDALLQVIWRWKLMLKADYNTINNYNLSTLFNAIIFIRGCEDRDLERPPGVSRLLLQAISETDDKVLNLAQVLASTLQKTGVGDRLSEFVSIDALKPFNFVDRTTALNLFRDFYAPRDAPYDFNFSLMSKHALSRIYERYVVMLRSDDSTATIHGQMSFVGTLPTEASSQKNGAIYTPQFIAGFFARYIKENVTPPRFRSLRSIDPACGSGIFLRTLLELQCDPILGSTTPASIQQAFSYTTGIDKDPNACEATRLSLALLHLVAVGKLPSSKEINILNNDSISLAIGGNLSLSSYDAVITNPPYIKLDHLNITERDIYRAYMGTEGTGRIDAYIPFIRLCLELSNFEGFICLVLPQVFLTASNAGSLRRKIAENFNVRCLIDLSAVPVFEGVGTYNILLIIQRRSFDAKRDSVRAQVAQITEFVGPALQACIDAKTIETPYYNVYSIKQKFFQSKNWVLVSPTQMHVDDRLRDLPRLSSFLNVKQGFVTGADDVFIMPKSSVPKKERDLYIDYLPDRQILRYRIPNNLDLVVFLPFKDGKIIDESELVLLYPETWAYLNTHRDKLKSRKSVVAGSFPWWRPERPREPDVLLRPKIVCPHLMLTPRFAVDKNGGKAVSHSPFMISIDEGEEAALLPFFCAVLNSSVCNWHLRTYAPKYGKGYNRLEVTLLNTVPVPDLNKVTANTLNTIIDYVSKISEHKGDRVLDAELDTIIAGLYGFTISEQSDLLGMK